MRKILPSKRATVVLPVPGLPLCSSVKPRYHHLYSQVSTIKCTSVTSKTRQALFDLILQDHVYTGGT